MYKVLCLLITVRGTEREELFKEGELEISHQHCAGKRRGCTLIVSFPISTCARAPLRISTGGWQSRAARSHPELKHRSLNNQLNQNVFLRNILLANYEESN